MLYVKTTIRTGDKLNIETTLYHTVSSDQTLAY